ncbi:hypothetical protein CEP51_016869, partial [Fusarium floridanum]
MAFAHLLQVCEDTLPSILLFMNNQSLPPETSPAQNYSYLRTGIIRTLMQSLTMPGKHRPYNSPYPLVPLLIVSVLQTASFLIAIPIISYLVFHLHNRHVFLHLLSAASYFTVLQLVAVTILSRFCRLPPTMRLIIDALGCALWIAGFAFMAAYDVKHKILARCSGHSICTLYKVMFASATVGL